MSIKPLAMRDALLDRIWLAMSSDPKIFFISADFGSPILDKIRRDFPKRFINVGVAEQNLINISAGLALEGYTIFAYAIAPFITMRCYEQIRVSLALLSKVRLMNVNLIGVGAGFSYAVSGPTHQCYEDLTLMRALPTFNVLSPADHICAGALFDRCIHAPGPKYIRLDAQILPVLYTDVTPDLNIGFHTHQRGKAVCLVATGYMLHTALFVAQKLSAQGYSVGVIDLFDLTHFDVEKLKSCFKEYIQLVTLEEGFRGRGGMDSMLFEFIARHRLNMRMLNIGVAGTYHFELGSRVQLHEHVGIGPEIVLKSIINFMQRDAKFVGEKNEISLDA